MKHLTYDTIKAQENRRRLAVLRQARRTARGASVVQRRVSLVGHGVRWQITNLPQVARGMAAWA